ncbi:hypothetical protein MXD63_11850 [Frankia sp. Cpl3]|nr:hypothetical protein [Frankia sp. Cpl3]
MTDRTSGWAGFDATFLLRLLLGVGGIFGTAVSLFGAMLMATNMTGDPTTRSQILAGDRALILAAVIAAGAPLAALLLAWLVHNRGAVQRWTVASVVGLIAAVVILSSRYSYLHQCLSTSSTSWPGGGTHCDEYSDAWRYAWLMY